MKTAATQKFIFTPENLALAEAAIKKYPEGKQYSAVLDLLRLAQQQNKGWLPPEAIEAVGDYLNMPYIRVEEVATFYEMFFTQPAGENKVWVCRTTPCWLRGSDQVTDACRKNLGIEVGETTADGKFTLLEMECLGACVNAPILWVNDDYYEDMNATSTEKVLRALREGKKLPIGSQAGRQTSAPLKEQE